MVRCKTSQSQNTFYCLPFVNFYTNETISILLKLHGNFDRVETSLVTLLCVSMFNQLTLKHVIR